MSIHENLLHGFELLSEKKVSEINCLAKIYRHVKSGARLFFLQTDDDNKVFSISFRTPPTDSTGVPHILEHSVLCGSRKFPVREPFVELVKGSLNTFLNAMTFPDKTMYPVASRNDKDFRNLMDVYLDAVFYPNIEQVPEIMMQEGWHYELENAQAELSYKGVVYNEMKGVFSSPDAVLERKIQETLFPESPYGVESGGDPEFIPNLTQEEFVTFHKKYYHPANSYIFLYGNLNIAEELKFIDEEYLSHFDRIEVDSAIVRQKSFDKTLEHTYSYPISVNEKPQDKTFLSLNFVVGEATDPETTLAFEILEHLLLGTPAAPLKKALLEAGIGKDVFGQFNQSILQPVLTVGVRGANEDKKAEFLKVVYETLQRLCTEGLDKKLVEASVNIHEFQLREANFGNYPKGLIYNIKCMDSWLYDESPLLHLAYEGALGKVKTALTSRYFEELIEQKLLQNKHQAVVVVKPEQGLAEAKSKELAAKLAEYKKTLTTEEIEGIVKQTESLKKRQTTPDTPEKLATIPLLSLKDISRKTEELPLVEKKIGATKLLFHPLFTNRIAYVNLYFDSAVVKQSLLPYLFLLDGVLGQVDTEKYTYSELSNEINIHTGGISSASVAYSEKDDDTIFYPKFKVKSKALVAKLPELLGLLGEILGHSRFDDKKRLKELIAELKSKFAAIILEKGQIISSSRVLSYVSPVSKFREIGYLSFYHFVADLEEHFDEKFAEIQANLHQVAELIFTREGMLISLTTDEADYKAFTDSLPRLCKKLHTAQALPESYEFCFGAKNEGLMTSAKVQYAAKGYNFRRLNFEYQGSMRVLETIMRYDYLWNRIRVQGGAYGAFVQFERNGNMVYGSYRDPNLAETVHVYDEAAQYIAAFKVTEREMTKYIIGTMSGIDSPLTASMKGERAAENYLQHITQHDMEQERREILETTEEKVRSLAALVDECMKQNYICVLGGEEKIQQNKQLFAQLVSVFE
ncbi:Zn-dependent M16 (insulinase) family peptidase [Sporomusaceae bacterium BoRhaA]|uniref:insulinase family protein n=1 Tax=Pelorhabdus rhamnosifermentans TaxID=2772457 RepID=UPI001C0604B0|nr:insulinase family protein [Pelorhabdus rhamnosifermentans]MBU2702873.1 Zn-dependent M16 (insulinase) family peptidase [Pelorhabdus rhamnosifermentans]